MFEHSGRRYEVVAVVAMGLNGIIGRDGAMPWTLTSDLKRYRRLTMGRPTIMGRKTLQSIGRVLDGRDTIVLTRSSEAPFAGALVAGDPDTALRIAADCAARRGVGEIAIVGGAEIYELFLGRTDRIEMTRIEARPDGDARFPDLSAGDWAVVADEPMERGSRDSAAARFITLSRSNAN